MYSMLRAGSAYCSRIMAMASFTARCAAVCRSSSPVRSPMARSCSAACSFSSYRLGAAITARSTSSRSSAVRGGRALPAALRSASAIRFFTYNTERLWFCSRVLNSSSSRPAAFSKAA